MEGQKEREKSDVGSRGHTRTHTLSALEEQAATADRFITALLRVGIHFWLQQQTHTHTHTLGPADFTFPGMFWL